MAFDGITVSGITYELNTLLKEGRISKIAQPEKDELQLTIKGADRTVYRLLISASATLPLIYITNDNKQSPLDAPVFCMLLRKHLQGSRIVNISQIDMERVIMFELEHLNEMGDLCIKYLIVELMGKHSNIIFCEKIDDKLRIIDSIKRINCFVSSVREVLPGKDYFIPNKGKKYNPLEFNVNMMDIITSLNMSVKQAIYNTLTGFSPVSAYELCERAGIDADMSANMLSNDEKLKLCSVIDSFVNDIRNCQYYPNIVYDNNKPVEFAVYHMKSFSNMSVEEYSSISEMLIHYYAEKNAHTRIKQ